jgi:hypothetical protein
MSVGAQLVVVLKAFVEHCVSLVFVIRSNFPGSMHPKQMNFINPSLFAVTQRVAAQCSVIG